MTNKELKEKIKIIQDLDWSVSDFGDYYELENYSPLGENLIYNVSKRNLVTDIENIANNFDVNEHAKMWVENMGTRGVPNSVRELVEDAEEIEKMLCELARKVGK